MGTPQEPGIIPRTCQDLFERINRLMSQDDEISCTVRISYFEVYNEHVHDLLAPHAQGPTRLKVRESPTEGPYVENLSEYAVTNVNQIMSHLNIGNKSRSTGSTKMNDNSSRSHAVFTLVVKQVRYYAESGSSEEKTARLRLVDLAGSERANSSGTTGQRLREGSNINKSLMTLGRVISTLTSRTNGSSKDLVVPYRDSVLTWLLKDSLGGNSKTAMVACISPTDYEETLSTLRYASQAKNITTQAIMNKDLVSAADRDKQVAEMQETINNLQTSLIEKSSSSQSSDKMNQELIKVRAAVRYFEERAINEENKRKALQQRNETVLLHNKLLMDHIKEVLMTQVGSELNRDSSYPTYDELLIEKSQLIGSIQAFAQDLQKKREKFSNLLVQVSV